MCLWPERFSEKDIADLRSSLGSELAWRTEYLLQEAGSETQIIKPEWIRLEDPPARSERKYESYLDSSDCIRKRLASDNANIYGSVTGVDLAVSEKDAADFTAFVSGEAWSIGAEGKVIYVTDAVQMKNDFPTTLEALGRYARLKESSKDINHLLAIEEA